MNKRGHLMFYFIYSTQTTFDNIDTVLIYFRHGYKGMKMESIIERVTSAFAQRIYVLINQNMWSSMNVISCRFSFITLFYLHVFHLF